MTQKIYKIADLGRVPGEIIRRFSNAGWVNKVRAIPTGEFRTPQKGEWYLSGALPAAYYAPNDLGIAFHILRLVIVETVTEIRVVETIE